MTLLKCYQTKAIEILLDQTMLNVDDLADQVAKVLDYFGWMSASRPCFQCMWIMLLFSALEVELNLSYCKHSLHTFILIMPKHNCITIGWEPVVLPTLIWWIP
jgi:hypothetical protein